MMAEEISSTSNANVSSNTTNPAPTASLYVGELHPEVTEAMLYEVFSQIGPVSSIRICRDAITRRSLGYAYVNFHASSDGERAIEALNYSLIRGQPCRIMWSQRDPSLRRSGLGNVFIKNLDRSIDNKALHDTFSVFGEILSCKVVCDEQSVSKGYGFVHFETQEAADEAIAKVNGMLLNDVKVFVGKHQTRRERLQALDSLRSAFTNIYVKNLPVGPAFSDSQFAGIFAPFGEIISAVVQRVPSAVNAENVDLSKPSSMGDSLGFGFVNFALHESAQSAVDALNGRITLPGASGPLYVGRAQKKIERAEELRRQFETMKLERHAKLHASNVYVKNLAETVDDERLRIEFSSFGTITSAKVMLDERGVSRGFGFVCFSAAEEAGRAITEMNGRMLLGKPLYVALAQRKDERRSQLEAQFSARNQQLRMQQQQQQQMLAAAAAAAAGGLVQPGAAPGGAILAPQMAAAAAAMFRYPTRNIAPNVSNMSAPFLATRAGPGFQGGSNSGYRAAGPSGIVRSSSGAPPGVSMPYRTNPITGAATMAVPSTSGSNSGIINGQRRPYAPSSGSRYTAGPNSVATGVSTQGMNNSARYTPTASRYQTRPLTLASLASATPEQQKRILGERLYPLIAESQPENAGKITGMILEIEPSEVIALLESPSALSSKVEEAADVLRKHSQQQQS